MLQKKDKTVIVDGLKADIDNAKGIFLTNLIGVPSNDAVAIRKNVRDASGKVVVTRNTLIKRASEGTVFEGLCTELKGPHAMVFAFEDAAAVAKCIQNAAKEHEVIEFKGGVLDGRTLSSAELAQLADLPSRDEMLGTLLATFNAPVSALARVLYSIQEQKESGAPAPVEAASTEEVAPTEES